MDRIHKIGKKCTRLCVKLNNHPRNRDGNVDFPADLNDTSGKNYLPFEPKVV